MTTTSIDITRAKHSEQLSGQYRLSHLFASEWIKLRTVRSTMWTIGATIVVGIGLSIIATAEARAHWSASSSFGFDPAQQSLIGVQFAQLVIGILGVLAMSGEYASGTIRATFSVAPRRLKVLLAKSAVFGCLTLAVSEVVSFLAFFVGQAMLTPPAIHATLATPQALRQVIGAGLYLCVLGLFALGLATIIRHTAGAIAAFVASVLVLPLIVQALPSSIEHSFRRFVPVNIGSTLTSAHPNLFSFSPWVGFAVLCSYAAAALGIGAFLLIRRDA